MLITGGPPPLKKRDSTRYGTMNTSDPTVMKRAIDMTDDELAAVASGATLHVVK